jgi:heme A synthase
MKLVTRTHRVLAVVMGLAVLVTLVVQILKDGRELEIRKLKSNQSIIK